jgi:hypothetical protein
VGTLKLSAIWEKQGLLFDPRALTERPDWMFGFAQAPNVLMFDDFIRVYFCCRPKVGADRQYVSYGAFVDLSKGNLFEVIRVSEHPIMDLGSIGTFDEFGTYPISVLRDHGGIIAAYGGWTRCESVPFNISLGLAHSDDEGLTFSKYGAGPVLSHSPDEPFVVTSPKLRKFKDKFFLFYTAGRRWIIADDGQPEIVYKLRTASSVDGINWVKLNRDIVEDKLGVDEAQACPDVFQKDGVYHMFFCYREGLDFRNSKERSYRIGYARSTDLENWRRDDSQVNLHPSIDGWDSQMIAYPTVFEVNNSIYMIYVGNGNGQTGFGLAKLNGELS